MKDTFDGKNGITFTGIITQKEIADILCKATFMIYPPDFPETFGISTLEALYYNVIPITSRHGALEQIAIEEMSYLMNYSIKNNGGQNSRFINLVNEAYYNKYLTQQKQYKCDELKPYVAWSGVALQWKQHFFRKFGMIMSRDETTRARELNGNYNKLFKVRHINSEDRIEYFPKKQESRIIIVTPMYNAEKYIANCINSVAAQLYDNYVHYIIDDCSTDNSVAVAKETISNLREDLQLQFHIIENKVNVGALANQVAAIKYVDSNPWDIVALLDGDDWLYNDPDIFTYINSLYPEYQMTYGSCWSLADSIPLIAQDYPQEVKENKSYRDYPFNWGIPYTHLRTFSMSLFNAIDLKQLQNEEGSYYKAGGDGSLMYAMLEESKPEEIKAVKRLLVNYNDVNPLNDYKVNADEQNTNQKLIVNKRGEEESGKVLYEIHQGVLNRDEESMKKYKDIVEKREMAWIDNLDGMWIKPRLEWVWNTFQRLNIPYDAKILDIGSWTGGFANTLYERGYTNITCLDINNEVVRLGSETFPHLNWLEGDIENCELEEQYDVVCMFEVLEHLFNPIETIEKLKGNLTDGGVLLYTIPTPDVVMGLDGNAVEHVSVIQQNQIEPISFFMDIVQSEDGFKWFSGGVNKNPKTGAPKKHIIIGVPTAKNIETATFKSIYDLIIPDGYETHIQFFYGYNIAQIRNLMANYTLLNGFDYMFWVDSDIVLPTDTLVKLLAHKKEIAAGVYIQRKHEAKIPEVYMWNDTGGMRNATLNEVHGDKLMEVAGIGFGCVLTSNKLLKEIGYPQFEYKSTLDFKDTVSEDVDFCIKAKNKGYKIYADTSIKCDHIGTHIFKIT